MSAPRLLEPLSARGASAQVAIAGTYAWAVTVAPVAGYHGAPLAAKVAAGAALLGLVGGAVAERWRRTSIRVAWLGSFAGASTLAWLLAPNALRPLAIDTAQGVAGMLGWGLFALACAGPALGDRIEPARVVDDVPLEARRTLARGDALYLVGGTAVALVLQGTGWGVVEPERALLVRLVALASGLAIVGASVQIALSRHAPRERRTFRFRLRKAGPALALLGALVLSGLLLAARG